MRNSKKVSITIFILTLVMYLVIKFFFGASLKQAIDIDMCLDAGGKYNKEAGLCEK